MKKTDEQTVRLASFLPYRINNLAKRISDSLAMTYAERFNVSIPEWRVIAVLGENSAITSKTISHITLMDKTKVSRAVSDLLEKGVVKKQTLQSDGRAFNLSLSAKGKKLYRQISTLALSWEESFIECLDSTEKKAFLKTIEKLEAHLDL